MNKSLAFVIILLLVAITQPCVLNAQSKFPKLKNAEDSLVLIRQHHSRWHPYGGLYLSSDAELYYLGLSFQAGLDFNLTRQLALSAYIHYFHTGANDYDNTGFNEKERFKTFTSAFLVQFDAGAGWYKGFFVGAGVALQQYSESYIGRVSAYDDKRTTFTPAIRVGYSFPVGLHAISIEFNGIGPYFYHDGLYGLAIEVFTQVSLGGRFIF